MLLLIYVKEELKPSVKRRKNPVEIDTVGRGKWLPLEVLIFKGILKCSDIKSSLKN